MDNNNNDDEKGPKSTDDDLLSMGSHSLASPRRFHVYFFTAVTKLTTTHSSMSPNLADNTAF